MASDFNPQFQKIGEILIHAGKIDENQLNSALAEQKQTNEKIGQTLVSAGAIDEDDDRGMSRMGGRGKLCAAAVAGMTSCRALLLRSRCLEEYS